MCGRYLLSTPAEKIAAAFGVNRTLPPLVARYNIAPTQMIPIIRAEDGGRALAMVRWGLVPFWAEDPSIGNRLINARAETAASKPAFRAAFERRRCLVPADGFYEWKKIAPKAKQPILIRPADHGPMAMAGLWERWRPKNGEGEPIESCTILTCGPNELIADIHDRMPVILEPHEYDRWLDPEATDAAGLAELLDPYPAELLEAYPVSRRINSPGHEGPECAAPAGPMPSEGKKEDPGLFS